MTAGKNPQSKTGKKITKLEGELYALRQEVNELHSVKKSEKSSDSQRTFSDVLKGIGLVILFVSWLWEHTKLSNWQGQKDQFNSLKTLVLHGIQVVAIDQSAVDYFLLLNNQNDTIKKNTNYYLTQFGLDAMSLAGSIYQLSYLNPETYPLDSLKKDTAEIARIEYSMHIFYEKGDFKHLKEDFDLSSQLLAKPMQHKMNNILTHGDEIEENIKLNSIRFLVAYIIGTVFLGLSYILERSWFRSRVIYEKMRLYLFYR